MVFPPKPQPQPKERGKKCKIVIKKQGNRIEKSIEGDCTAQEIKALSQPSPLDFDLDSD